MANTSPTKPSTPSAKVTAKNASLAESASSTFAAFAIPIAFVVATLIYLYIFGDPSHFVGGDPAKGPIPGDMLGTIHAGGIIVPILVGMLILVITFAFERFFTINKAEGKGSVATFVAKVKSLISRGEIDAALAEADRQKGSVGNVVKAGLLKYKEVDTNYNLDQERKLLAIQKDIEETTQLEMPMLQKKPGYPRYHCLYCYADGLVGNSNWYDPGFCCLGKCRRAGCSSPGRGYLRGLDQYCLWYRYFGTCYYSL